MPSPWVRRMIADNDHVAKSPADFTLNDRVAADALIEITGIDTAWGTALDADTLAVDDCFDVRGPLAPHRHFTIADDAAQHRAERTAYDLSH